MEYKTNSAESDPIGILGRNAFDCATTTSKIATISITNSSPSNRNYSITEQHDNKFDDSSLDNHILVNKNTLTNPKRSIGMTLVDMHPLMVKSDEDFSPDATTTLNTHTGHMESKFMNNASESTMHVSPKHHFNSLCLLNKNVNNDKSYLSSGESELDISLQASVEPTLQSVSLTNFNTGKMSKVSNNNSLRKIPLTAELMVTKEDDSSMETISDNSFDDDIEDEDGIHFKETKSNRHVASKQETVFNRLSICNENELNLQQPPAISVTLSNGQTR